MTHMMKALRRTEVLTSRCQWVSAVGRNLSEPHAIKIWRCSAPRNPAILIIFLASHSAFEKDPEMKAHARGMSPKIKDD